MYIRVWTSKSKFEIYYFGEKTKEKNWEKAKMTFPNALRLEEYIPNF